MHELREQADQSWDAYDAAGNYLLSLDKDGYDQVLRLKGLDIKRLVNRTGAVIAFDKKRDGKVGIDFETLPVTSPGPTYQEPVRFLVDTPVFTKRGTAPLEIEGHWLKVGDRVLLTGQPDPEHNGIYTVSKVDYEGATWVVVETPTEGSTVTVTEGIHAGTLWTFTANHSNTGTPHGWLVFQVSAGAVEPLANHPDNLDDLFTGIFEGLRD